MKSKTSGENRKKRGRTGEPPEQADEVTGQEDAPVESELDSDDDDPDDAELQRADDGRWDVFLFDDDADPLPDYGDFWFPD